MRLVLVAACLLALAPVACTASGTSYPPRRDSRPHADGLLTDIFQSDAAPVIDGQPAGDALPFPVQIASQVILKTEAFANAGTWSGQGNQISMPCLQVNQAFGYSKTSYTGSVGEIGGKVARSITPAYYGYVHPTAGLTTGRLAVDGNISLVDGNGEAYIGWFNSGVQGWRPANFIGMRLDGANVELSYTTGTFKSGGAMVTTLPADKKPHYFLLEYLADGNGGKGVINFKLDQSTFQFAISDTIKSEPTTLNRFGIMNVQKPGAQQMEVYIDDLYFNVDNSKWKFDTDPQWDGSGNKTSFTDCKQRGAQTYGHSATGHAGGAAGEVGGLFWRFGPSDPTSYFADSVKLTLSQPLYAAGKVGFVRGAVDSGVLIGWFSSAGFASPKDLKGFVGVAIEGPSAVGHYFNAMITDLGGDRHRPAQGPVILPDGKPQQWSFAYDPSKGAFGEITVSLGAQSYTLAVPQTMRQSGAKLDRFGLTPRFSADGQSLEIFFDDLTYVTQPKP